MRLCVAAAGIAQITFNYRRIINVIIPSARLPLPFLVLPVLTARVLLGWKHTMMNICPVLQVVW